MCVCDVFKVGRGKRKQFYINFVFAEEKKQTAICCLFSIYDSLFFIMPFCLLIFFVGTKNSMKAQMEFRKTLFDLMMFTLILSFIH